MGMAVVLAMTLNDLDKCEKKPSAHCPYFTSPQALNTGVPTKKDGGKGGDNIAGYYQTQVRLPNAGEIPLDPFVYKN